MQGTLFLRQSNVKLQEELRKANKAYVEEKANLRCQLSGLRLDLSELHRDDMTITTEETQSRTAPSLDSESELKRLAEFEGDLANRSLQLPTIKNINIASNNKKNDKEKGNKKFHENKTLRFDSNSRDEKNTTVNGSKKGENGSGGGGETKQENQKFLELQKNQEFLRSIGRANLKEKRQSLIRLPTITSAKKRNSQWDSGNNVSRPKGMSTSFEQNPYVKDSISLSKRTFNIPSIKDSQRSEIHLSDTAKRPSMNKRKVQFTRPRPDNTGSVSFRDTRDYPGTYLDTSTTEASSLNTTMADVSLEDNTLGNITFDEEAFNKKLAAAKQLDTLSSSTSSKPSHNKHRHHNTSSTPPLQPIHETSGTLSVSKSDKKNNHQQQHCPTDTINNDNKTTTVTNNNNNDDFTLPPIEIKTLAKKNLILHNMNNMRTSPTSFPKLRLSPDEEKSVKDSDKSDRTAGTKFSRISQETESWKSTYVKYTDPEKRNKTLTEIMFAVRSRMRDNEETIRFGETPRPKDKTLSDLLLSRSRNVASPRWSDATQSPRKGKVSKRSRPAIPPTKADKSSRRTDCTGHLQGYLRKMCRHRRFLDQPQDYSSRHGAQPLNLHKQPRMIVQQA